MVQIHTTKHMTEKYCKVIKWCWQQSISMHAQVEQWHNARPEHKHKWWHASDFNKFKNSACSCIWLFPLWIIEETPIDRHFCSLSSSVWGRIPSLCSEEERPGQFPRVLPPPPNYPPHSRCWCAAGIRWRPWRPPSNQQWWQLPQSCVIRQSSAPHYHNQER